MVSPPNAGFKLKKLLTFKVKNVFAILGIKSFIIVACKAKDAGRLCSLEEPEY